MFVVVQEPPAVAVRKFRRADKCDARGSEKMNAWESEAKLEKQYIKLYEILKIVKI